MENDSVSLPLLAHTQALYRHCLCPEGKHTIFIGLSLRRAFITRKCPAGIRRNISLKGDSSAQIWDMALAGFNLTPQQGS